MASIGNLPASPLEVDPDPQKVDPSARVKEGPETDPDHDAYWNPGADQELAQSSFGANMANLIEDTMNELAVGSSGVADALEEKP